MAKLWLKDGKIVSNADGNIVICDDCPCTPPVVDCNGYDIPSVLYATLGGVFSVFGTVTLRYNFSGPFETLWTWQGSAVICGLSLGVTLRLGCQGDGNVILYVVIGAGTQTYIFAPSTYVPFFATYSGTVVIATCSPTTQSFSIDFTETAP